MASKSKDRLTREYMSRVAELGCLICGSPAELHHARTDQIKDDYLIIPLCPDHHRGPYSIHGDQRQFEKMEGSQLHLLAETNKRLFSLMMRLLNGF